MENPQHAAAAPLMIVLLLAALASISLNLGKVIQKMKVVVLRQGKGVLTKPYRRDFLIWCFGMSLTIVAGALIMVAQKMSDKASLVSALNGVGLVAVAFFSWLVLKERVGVREWGAILLIILGTAAVSIFNEPRASEPYFNVKALMWGCGITVVLLSAMLAFTLKLGKGQAFVYAAIAGVALGLMNVFYHCGPIAAGGLTEQFSTAYPYIGIMIGNSAFVFTNIAFLHGTGITIVPTINSFMIISPMIFEVFIFRTSLVPAQYIATAVIVAGVIVLTTGGMADPSLAAKIGTDAQKPEAA